MKNPFKRESASFRSEAPLTPYQRARQEWDLRIGIARVQAKNWRLATIFSLLVSLLLVITLLVSLGIRKDRLYIAEVTQEGKVINISPLLIKYQPTEAQKNYFLSHFIKLARGIPLDPVLARKNWIAAYTFLDNHSSEQLNKYLKENNPVALLGKKTISVQILDINPITPTTIYVDWIETTAGTTEQQKGESSKSYSGVFTTAIRQPRKQEEILNNPLGLFITDFNISPKVAASPKLAPSSQENGRSAEQVLKDAEVHITVPALTESDVVTK